MNHIGLALSGGGFRATLFHLGGLRFLRDANLLRRISHITSVSGGSIMAAHLVLNWHRYAGSEQDYDEAAAELLDFIRMDVRNRVVRRFPLALAANSLRWLTRQGRSRRLTRPGLLEMHYEKYLYGDKCLYELPATPQLHMLATNINEGCLCSFTRSGLLVERRKPGGGTQFEHLPTTLATIPMAVTASSAFPGFFPPLQLTAKDVGLEEGRFPHHLFTDGGIYDNLGVRMFRHLQGSWIGHATPLRGDDFVDLEAASKMLSAEANVDVNTALGRLGVLVRSRPTESGSILQQVPSHELPRILWNVIANSELYRDPAFGELVLDDEQATDLFRLARRGRDLETGDRLWLNRQLVQAAFRAAGIGDIFHKTQTEFDAVIVSDAGKKFAVSRRTKAGGLVGVALRATDILMNRVWQLENDHFGQESDFVFAPMSMTVYLADDPTALNPEVQHQVTNTRTDLDRFSDLEISGLVRHGYGVMRQVCRSRPELFGSQLPSGPPWDPTTLPASAPLASTKSTSLITQQARELQSSSHRKIASRLFSIRDWPTYIFVPLLIALLVGTPYVAYRAYQKAHRSEMIVDAITFSNPDFQLVLQLARQNPVPGEWIPLTAEEVPKLEPSNIDGFQLLTDTRVLDLRAWGRRAGQSGPRYITYRRMLVRRTETTGESSAAEPNQNRNRFRLQQFALTNQASVRCDTESLHPVLRVAPHVSLSGEEGFLYEIEFDLSSVPEGQTFAIGFEVTEVGLQGRTDSEERLIFPIIAPTDVATMWVLLPQDRPYRSFQVIGYDERNPANVEAIDPTYDFQMADGSMFGWMLVAPRLNHVYDCQWSWRD